MTPGFVRRRCRGRKWGLLALLLAVLSGWPLAAQNPSAPARLLVTITDENGVVVPGARVVLDSAQVFERCETDAGGRCRFSATSGSYELTASKEGFYQLHLGQVRVGETANLDLTLAHLQEVKETVNVTESVPAIDPAQTASSAGLNGKEIIDIPFPTTRDIRYALPLIPGVVRDNSGQAHVAGSETSQTLDLLDGFDITNPVTGTLNLRFSADAVRSIDGQSSRYSVAYGRASGGVVGFDTGMGDDHFRFNATNFVPSVQTKKGVGFEAWTPRATFSGPLKKGKAWFLLAPEFEYDNNIFPDLPDGSDRNPVLRGSNLAKMQVNASAHDIFSGSFLVGRMYSEYAGISLVNPQEATQNLSSRSYLGDIREQHYFSGGGVLEVGMAASSYLGHVDPQGTAPYVIHPDRNTGNYFLTAGALAGRLEGRINYHLPPLRWLGTHDVLAGADVQSLSYREQDQRRPFTITREDGTLLSAVSFQTPPQFTQDNLAGAGYAEDNWSPQAHLLIQPGLRWDRDRIIGRNLISPRVSGTYMLAAETKVSAGIGVYYDATNLDLVSRPLAGERLQTFYAADGVTPLGPAAPTSFHLDPSALREPHMLNWSLALEQELPAKIFLRAEYIRKRGRDEFTYVNLSPNLFVGDYGLQNSRQDHIDLFQVEARRTFKDDHVMMASYTRSAARSNAVLDFSVDSPFSGAQAGGPLPWDSPNRLLAWGFLPAPHFKRWSFAYVADWRTGFPFNVVNQYQQLVGPPDSRRFPDYLSIDLFAEVRFGAIGHNWALRGGLEDLNNRHNPMVVNNNIDSPDFLQYSVLEHRAFTARIRFLGRK